MVFIALLTGCLFLYKGGDWLLDGMLDIGQRLRLSKAIVGLVLVSLGTSAPELFVSVGAALHGHGGMAAGNVVGSNIINISIVLGITLCIVTLNVERVLQQQMIAVIGLSGFTVWVTIDGYVSRVEGVLLLTAMIVSLLLAVSRRTNTVEGEDEDVTSGGSTGMQTLHRSILLTLGGIVFLVIGAESLIWGGVRFADKLNISETVVALTVTALGTCLPEIAASVVAVVRRDTSLALGNVIGSNLLNIGLVLGVSAVIMPLQNINLDRFTLVLFAGLATVIYALSVKPGYLPRWSGYVLVSSYILYVLILIKL